MALGACVVGCRTAPPFEPARFVEPQECAADAECGPGRECLVFDSFSGAQWQQCVISCFGPKRLCPAGYACSRREHDGATGPYCAKQSAVDAGGTAFAGATGWDEAYWVEVPDGGWRYEEPAAVEGCNRDADCVAGKLCSCRRKECSLFVLATESSSGRGSEGQCFSREIATEHRMLKRR